MMAFWTALVLLAIDDPALKKARLDADAFSERKVAEDMLWREGRLSIPTLEAYTKGDDPEAALRARRILRKINLGLTPETPREVIEGIENYLVADSMKEREAIYQDLLARKAIIPLLRLPRYLRNESVANNLAERLAVLVGTVAEDLVLAGKESEALEVLNEARSSRVGYAGWISLASAMGIREFVWEDLSQEEKVLWARWEGDEETILALAPEDDESRKILRVLHGDPIPMIKELAEQPDIDGIRARLALAHWQGGDKEAERKALLEIVELAVEDAPLALQVLGQAGYRKDVLNHADEYFDKTDLFQYFASIFDFEKAFQIYGLKFGEPIPDAWLKARLKLVDSVWDESNEGCSDIYEVASFLAINGEKKEAERLFAALWNEFRDSSDNLQFISQLLYRYRGELLEIVHPEFAVELIKKSGIISWTPEVIMEELWGESVSRYWWRRIQEIRPAWDPWEQWLHYMDLIGLKMSLDQDSKKKLYAQLMNEALAGEPEEMVYEELLMIVLNNGTMSEVERITRELLKHFPNHTSHRENLGKILMGWEKYEEATEIFKVLAEEDPANREARIQYYVCSKMAGKDDVANNQYRILEKLSLGQSGWLVTLAKLWKSLGEYERAYQSLRLALLRSRMGNDEHVSQQWLTQCNSTAESARQAGRWRIAASLGEIYEVSKGIDDLTELFFIFNVRGEIDYARAMAAFEAGNDEEGRALLDFASELTGHHRFFADEALYELNRMGKNDETRRFWEKNRELYHTAVSLLKNSDNVQNGSAWVASRAAQDLEEALQRVNRALELKPNSGAYLDTKAEIYFAMGQREEALKWSQLACEHAASSVDLIALRVQYRHFQSDPFPPKLPLVPASE